MPRIGNVEVSDSFANALGSTPTTERPSIGSIFSGAAQQAYGQVRYGLPYAFEKATQSLTPQDEQFFQQGLQSYGEAARAAAPAQVSDLTSGRVGIGRFIAENLAASGPQSLSILAGGIGGGLLGGPGGALAGAVAVGTPQFVGSNVDRAVQEEGGLSSAAAERAFAVAPVQAASDALVQRYLPGAGQVLGEFASTQTGGFLARTAKSIVKAGTTEAVTEAGQQLGERYAAGLPVTSADAAAEYVNAAVTAFAIGGALGAGGGFRRHPTIAKPATQVTNDDLGDLVDTTLALPAPSTPRQLALPSPDNFPPSPATADIVVDRRGNAAPVIDQNQVAAESATLRQPSGDVVVDARGNAAVGPDAEDQLLRAGNQDDGTAARRDFLASLAARGQLPPTGLDVGSPAVQEFFANREQLLAQGRTFSPIDITNPNNTSTSVLAQDAARGNIDASPISELAGTAPRLFRDDDLETLLTASKSSKLAPEVVQGAQEELQTRYAEAAGTAPLTSDNFQTRLDAVKAGLRGGFVSKLTAADPQELVSKVYDEIFTNQNTQSNVTKLAQRLGLLDDKLEPTPVAANIEAQRTAALQADAAPVAPVGTPIAQAPTTATVPEAAPAAPAAPVTLAAPTVDPTFAPEFKKLTAGLRNLQGGVDLKSVPANAEAFRAQVFDALARDPSEAAVSQTEKLAQKLGLITNDDAREITPLGRQAYLNTSAGLEDIVSTAQQQGYTGAQASIFERGVRAQLAGADTGSFTTFEDLAAYQAGKTFAEKFVREPQTKTLTQSTAIQARQAARATGQAVARGDIRRTELTPGQLQQQSLNRVLDAAVGLRDEDAVLIRKLIRDGGTNAEVSAAIQRATGGTPLFAQPATDPTVLSPPPTRGQPTFKELNVADREPGKAYQRAQSEAAVRAYGLRDLINFALAERGINQARADRLNAMLDEGKVDAVAKNLKAFGGDELTAAAMSGADPAAARKRFWDAKRAALRDEEAVMAPLSAREYADYQARTRAEKQGQAPARTRLFDPLISLSEKDFALEEGLTDKSFADALQHLIDNAPSPANRAILQGVKALAAQVEKAGGHAFDIKIAKPGDIVPVALLDSSVRAYTRITREPATSTVWLKSTALGGESGINFQLATHEMIHAVTLSAIEYARANDPEGKTKLGQAVKDLTELRNAIVRNFNKNANTNNLSEFEERYYNRNNNSLADVHEIVAWGLTNPEMQRYLQSVEYKPKQSVFARFVQLVREVLGISGKYDTALTELLRVSEQVLGLDARDLAPVFVRDSADGDVNAELSAPAQSGSTAAGANDITQSLAGLTERAIDSVNLADLGSKARKVFLTLKSLNQIVREYGDKIPGVRALSDAYRTRDAINGRVQVFGDAAYQGYEQLKNSDKESAKRLNQLIDLVAKFRLDPEKAFEAHTHLGFDVDADGKIVVPSGKESEIARLRGKHAEVVKLKNDLSRNGGAGFKVYSDFRTLNEFLNYAQLSASLHALVAGDAEYSLGVQNAGLNPTAEFIRQELTTPAQVRDYFRTTLEAQVVAANAYINRTKGETAGASTTDQRLAQQKLSPLQDRVNSIYESLAGAARSPYFHLGRFGDNFGSAVIKKNADGTVSQVALEAVAKAIEAGGFGNAQIATDERNPKFYLRFETVDQQQEFAKLAQKLEQDGHLEQDTIKTGPRTQADNLGVSNVRPAYIERLLANIETAPQYIAEAGAPSDEVAKLNKQKELAKQNVIDTWLEGQPDNSISKVLTARNTTPGSDADLVRSFAHRYTVGASSLAGIGSSPLFNSAFGNIQAEANKALNPNAGIDPQQTADVLRELQARQGANPIDPTGGTLDKVRALTHAYFLGFSPAYGLVNLTQVGVVALPELAKQNGFVKSFHALRRATPVAIAILRAASSEAIAQGPKNAAGLVITEATLKKAGLDAATADFVRKVIATGTIDIGSSARALGEVAKGRADSTLDVGLKYASAVGLYTETISRLVTALAARDLHGGDVEGAVKYATKTVSESLFDYQNWNTARALGKRGVLGPVTPIVTQFAAYSVQLTEKLYSEILDVASKQRPGETAADAAARRQGARTFLLGHMTAVATLAGTLGLPFASVFATAIERLVSAARPDDPPYDATAAYRNFLASVFGKDVAEVVARGAPRALGFDLSTRAGEQDLLPFSKFIGDRRTWGEAIQSFAGRSVGAAPDALANILDSGRQFQQGNITQGLINALPVGFKNPLKAYQLTTEGYVDGKGNKLPLTPGARDILVQLLGFSPQQKAEYSEARGDQQSRRLLITTQGSALRQNIIKSIVAGDSERAKELITRAQTFDTANPEFAITPTLQSTLQRQQTSAANARALGAPLGVRPKDIAGRALTGYANLNLQ